MEGIKKNNLFTKKYKEKFGVLASEIDQRILINKRIPIQIRDEIPTLNKMGYMKLDLEYFSNEFISYSDDNKELVLDLGCAYGAIVKKVLEKGNEIIASDLSEGHLEILIKNCSKEELKKLYLYSGKFPEEINLPNDSLGAVFTSRMFHFLDGYDFEKGLRKIHNWLKPNGKLFFIVVTPYHNAIKDGCLQNYENKVNQGLKWPGEIENQWKINPRDKDYVQPYLHVFNKEQLEDLLPKYGFKIEEIKYFDFPNNVKSNNKGHIGFIATKI